MTVPFSSIDTLWRVVAEERVTVFGTNPAYLKMCEDASHAPGRRFDLGALRAMLSTGAVLFDAQFRWVRDYVKPLQLQSISGGTNLPGRFGVRSRFGLCTFAGRGCQILV
jgi:acetoacetyl-CoA synthetase